METLVQILSFATSAGDAALALLFFHNFLQGKTVKKRVIIGWIVITTLMGAMMDWAGVPHLWKSVAVVLWSAVYCRVALRQKIGAAVFLSALFMSLLYICESAVLGLSGLVFAGEMAELMAHLPYQLFCMVVSRGLLFIVVGLLLLALRCRKTRADTDFVRRPYWVLLCAGATTFGAAIALLNYSLTLRPRMTQHVLPVLSAVFLLVVVLFLLLAAQLSRSTQRQQTMQAELLQAEHQLRQQDEQQVLYGKMQGLRHDYRNHLQIISTLCAQGKQAELQAYLGSLTASFAPGKNEVHTGNPYLDALFSSKIALATAHGITVHLEIRYPTGAHDWGLTDSELCTVLFNLLDNAIEACEKNEQPSHKQLWLQVAQWRGFLRIECKNPCDCAPKRLKNGFQSAKIGDLHGIGLRQIASLARQCGAEFTAEYDAGGFVARFLVAGEAAEDGLYVASITAAPQERKGHA